MRQTMYPNFSISDDLVRRFFPDAPTARLWRSRPTFTYFVEAEGTGRVKIGKSDRVGKRLKSLQTACPHKLTIRLVLPVGWESLANHPTGSWGETVVHDRFEKFRIQGEWFHLSPEIEAFINGIAKINSCSNARNLTHSPHLN
jgi:Meiotically up-regulated gene 113